VILDSSIGHAHVTYYTLAIFYGILHLKTIQVVNFGFDDGISHTIGILCGILGSKFVKL
jgi:hypothetical protein